ncbi:MAG: peptide deformylase [Clostridia bacterium]
MAKRTIFTQDAPCLHKKCRPVDNFDSKLNELLDDMAETLYDAEGVGLAAPQIGILRRITVIDAGGGLVEMINPEIIETSGEQGCMEGCLSVPGKSGYVLRPNNVKARAYNRNGELVEYEAEGLFARAIMHETDHLDGLIYTRLVTEPPEGYGEDDDDDAEDI